MIEITGLQKNYGDFTAVSNLNLKVNKGEIFGFLGPNGAGKTTTIKMMSGLIAITKGTICIGGKCISDDPIEYKKKFALIPDNPYMFDKLRGIEYVEFVGNLYNIPKITFEKNLKKYMKVFGTEDFINDFIESYSHGMRQKLLLTASLIHEPQVLILDEPMVGLDPKAQKTLIEELKKVAKKGMTVFMSTHSIQIAEEVCSTVGIIDKGVLVDTGKLAVIKKRNKSRKLEDLFFKLTKDKY
jgi:ABC-2 type transport system ATP-binding protein